MQSVEQTQEDKPVHPVWGRVALFAFGLAILAFLTLIERQNWFEIKPATGTAKALSYAAGDREQADAPQ